MTSVQLHFTFVFHFVCVVDLQSIGIAMALLPCLLSMGGLEDAWQISIHVRYESQDDPTLQSKEKEAKKANV